MVKTLLQLLFAYSEFGYPVVICYVQLYVLYLKKNCPSFFQLNFNCGVMQLNRNGTGVKD